MSYVQGVGRDQMAMTSLDMMVDPRSDARVVDAFVDGLDLGGLGFRVAGGSDDGRPAYDPRILLKLYVWGYRNGVRSSRKLMAACSTNVEAMWLAEGLRPDYRTIANFRRDNAGALKAAFRELVRKVTAVTGTGYVAVDGTKVLASNAKDSNFTASKLDDRISWLNGHIDEYLRQLDLADEGGEAPAGSLTKDELEAKLREARERLARYEGYRKIMEDEGLSQLSLTDADARLMKCRNGFGVAYNVQAAVDSETHMITSFLETANATDHGLMAPTVAPIVPEDGIMEATADKGYVQDGDMVACLERGILPSVILPDGQDHYDLEVDHVPADDVDPTGTRPSELARCLHAGVVPDAYADLLEAGEPVERRVFVRDDAGDGAGSPYGTEDEMRERAAEGYFVRDPERNLVWCPNGDALRQKCVKRNGNVRYANKTACKRCPLRDRCGPQKCGWKEVDFNKDALEKPIRGFHAGGGDREGGGRHGHYETRTVVPLRLTPDRRKCANRMCLSEHPFGTIKRAMGGTHFLLRGLEKVGAEFGLMAMGYNLARARTLLPFDRLMAAMA